MVEPRRQDGQAGRRLRAVVIGTGGISKEHLHFLSTSDRADLAGVCDLSPAAVTYAAETYSTTPYRDAAAMIDAPGF